MHEAFDSGDKIMASVAGQNVRRSTESGRGDDGPALSIDINVSGEILGMLDHLAQDSGLTIEEVVLRAFVVYKEVVEARRQGKAVGIAPSPDVLETQFVGF
jgi:hypothetical protein